MDISPKLEKISDTLKIYQAEGVFSYGTDAVLLSAYAAGNMLFSKERRLFDLCSGTGIVGLLLLDRFPHSTLILDGIEINEAAVSLSCASAEENNLSQYCNFTAADVKDIPRLFPADIADFVTVNPPYMSAKSGFSCESEYKNIARHEILCTLEDIFKSAFHLLKTGGSMFVVYRPDRLSTLFSAAHSTHFEIKKMTYVHSKPDTGAKLVLCKAQKNAKEGMKISKPLYIYNGDGTYTEEYEKIKAEGVINLD